MPCNKGGVAEGRSMQCHHPIPSKPLPLIRQGGTLHTATALRWFSASVYHQETHKHGKHWSRWLTSTGYRFKVEDDPIVGGDELLSWACIRLDRLRPGFRFIRLTDTKNRPIEGGKLLVKIDKVVR
ncbi:phosphatidylinositol-specific phospholipase C [Colletotrichum tofieldiae]|nr:phosphatidylinositol-specific phospholipase C [Colletotrichum tofieldiae]GKT69649.1 phosphatidylinositol-specific phospholipase C [Colletotrichum tofieldiae]GKT92531.1 phosphatidylinositol-specific phospholipase C [Colletotrichum tofieldiae]